MSGLLLIDLIDCLAGARNEFCTDTKPARLRHLELPVGFHHIYHPYHARTFTLYRDYAAHAIRSMDITPTLGIKRDSIDPLYHDTRVRTCWWPSLCQLPTFPTRNNTYNSSTTSESYKASWPGYLAAYALSSYWSKSFVDYTDLSARLHLSPLSLF